MMPANETSYTVFKALQNSLLNRGLIPPFFAAKARSLHYPKYVAALLLDQLEWQYVSR